MDMVNELRYEYSDIKGMNKEVITEKPSFIEEVWEYSQIIVNRIIGNIRYSV